MTKTGKMNKIIIGMMLIMLLVVIACSGTDDSSEWSAPEVPRAEVKSEQSPTKGKTSDNELPVYNPGYSDVTKASDLPQGGTFVRLYSDPPSLDPHTTSDATSSTVIVEIFGGLVTIDPNLNFIPDLAESWDLSSDGRTYEFKIRKDAKFHDGSSVTAEDFKWSFERAASPDTKSIVASTYLGDIVGVADKLASRATSISGVKVIDEHTLTLTIDQPKAYFLPKLTYPTAFVLDNESVNAAPDTWMFSPNGTGPFVMSAYTPGEYLQLKRNNLYHLGAPNLDSVDMILSGGNSMIMYENDEIDISGIGIDDLDRALDPSSNIYPDVVKAPPAFNVNYIGMNVNEPPFDDPKVRQALNMSINKAAIAETLYGGLIVPANGILPFGFPGFSDEVKGYDYDPEQAKALLQESTYGDNLETMPTIQLSIPGGFGAPIDLDLEVMLQEWEQNLGITVNIQQTEWATFLQDLNKRRFQMFKVGWIADYPDPENFLDVLFHSESTNNHTGYTNPAVDTLLNKARVETDTNERFELYNEAENQILSDAPWIPLWNSAEGYLLIKPHVKNYYLTPLSIPKLRYIYFEKGSGS